MSHKLYRKFGFIFIVFVLAISVIAIAQVTRPHMKFEAESGARSSTVSVISDANASAGQGVLFGSATGPSGKKCAVWLHGKGGDGGPTSVDGDVTWISPTGNGDGGGWGPHHWEYATSTTFNQALSNINSSVTPQNCGQIAVVGFSNGGAMAAKIFCQGQTFSNRLVGVIVDDPVPDQVVDNCAPGSDIGVRLIMSNDMGWITDGAGCPGGWTCQGTLYGRATYQARLGAPVPVIKQSHVPSGELYEGYNDLWWN